MLTEYPLLSPINRYKENRLNISFRKPMNTFKDHIGIHVRILNENSKRNSAHTSTLLIDGSHVFLLVISIRSLFELIDFSLKIFSERHKRILPGWLKR